MDFLSKPCESCNNPMNGGVYKSPQVCPHCGYDHAEGVESKVTQQTTYTEEADIQPSAISEDITEPQPTERQQETAIAEEAIDSSADITEPSPVTETAENVEELVTSEPTVETVEEEVAELEESIAVQEAPQQVEEPRDEAPQAPAAQESFSDPISTTPPAYEVSELEPADVKLSNEYPTDKMVSADLGELLEETEVTFAITASMIQDGKFVGAKSPEVKNAMKKARAKALSQLRNSAAMSGANMVANIETNYGLKAVDAKTAKVTAKVEGLALAVEEEEDEYGMA